MRDSGSTNGCSITRAPEIPNNVFVPEADLVASPDLRDAVQLVNSGLSALHTGWTNFQFACNSGNLRDKVTKELPNAQVAADAFATAQTKLEMVQGVATPVGTPVQ